MAGRIGGEALLADGRMLSGAMLRQLFLGQCLVLALHLAWMPAWLAAIALLVAGYRYLQLCGRLPRAGVLARLAGVGGLAGGLWLYYGTLGQMEAMIGLLLGVYLLKLLETHSRRDGRVVVAIGLVATTVAFLHDQGMPMAAGGLVVLAWLVHSLVWLSGGDARQAWRESAWLLVLSAPLMLMLFAVFPRLGPLWNLPQADRASTGLTDEIAPGDIARLSRSDARAFRARFEGPEPAPAERYWRVYTLSDFDGERWRRTTPERLAATLGRPLDEFVVEGRRSPWLGGAPRFEMELLLEPDSRPWRPSLGAPLASDERQRFLADGTLEGTAALASRSLLRMRSSGRAPANPDPAGPAWHAMLPTEGNPRSRDLAERLWRESGGEPRAFLAAIMARFGEAPFRYTLSPPRLTSADRVDEFLFESRAGYCTHYASALAVLSRSAGLPARVVAGFLGGERHPDGHFIVRDYDAHAWVEVWLAGAWQRIDPTAAIAPERIEEGPQALGDVGEAFLADAPFSPLRLREVGWINRMRLDWERLEYRWQRGVIGYQREARNALMSRATAWLHALWDRLVALAPGHGWLGGLLGLLMAAGAAVGLGTLLRLAWRRHRETRDEALRVRRLQHWLGGRGLGPWPGESPSAHLRRVAGEAGDAGPALRDCAHHLERLRYAPLGRQERRERTRRLARRVAEVRYRLRRLPRHQGGWRGRRRRGIVKVIDHEGARMSLHDHQCRTAQGEPFNFGALRGQVLLIVNVASRCSFTPQLRELERLYRRYRERGFAVIGFPCNQFARQSPESAQDFCIFSARKYQVSFPLMEKVKVNGAGAHPLFVELRKEAPGVLGTTAIKWNFTKFLVGRDGRVIRRFSPRDGEDVLRVALELALDEG